MFNPIFNSVVQLIHSYLAADEKRERERIMNFTKFIHLTVLVMICAYLKRDNNRKMKGKYSRNSRARAQLHNIYEVDAPGDDFVDFGAMSGPLGQFSWHADFPLE